MRIDPKGMISGYPALVERKALRNLRNWDRWGTENLETAAALAKGTGRAMVKALRSEGLVEASGTGRWTITQAGRTLAAATAAKPVTRATAERALSQFMERVTRVNQDPYFLSKVTRVVMFGSMLKPEVDRLSDVDLAVELARKETDGERARLQNQQRAEELPLMAAASGLSWSGKFVEYAMRNRQHQNLLHAVLGQSDHTASPFEKLECLQGRRFGNGVSATAHSDEFDAGAPMASPKADHPSSLFSTSYNDYRT